MIICWGNVWWVSRMWQKFPLQIVYSLAGHGTSMRRSVVVLLNHWSTPTFQYKVSFLWFVLRNDSIEERNVRRWHFLRVWGARNTTRPIRPTNYRTAVFYRKHCVLALMVFAFLGLPNVCAVYGFQNESIFRHQLPVFTENSSTFVLTAMRDTCQLVSHVALGSVHEAPAFRVFEFSPMLVIFQKWFIEECLIFLQLAVVSVRSLGLAALAIPRHWLFKAYQSVVYHSNQNLYFWIFETICDTCSPQQHFHHKSHRLFFEPQQHFYLGGIHTVNNVRYAHYLFPFFFGSKTKLHSN